MNIFQKISLINRISKAIKKSKKIIDEKKEVAEKVRKHIENIMSEFQNIVRILPDLRNIYFEIVEIIEETKWRNI